MPKYKVQVEWSGYSRGYSLYEVEANSKEEAEELYWESEPYHVVTIRDDTEDGDVTVTLIEDTN